MDSCASRRYAACTLLWRTPVTTFFVRFSEARAASTFLSDTAMVRWRLWMKQREERRPAARTPMGCVLWVGIVDRGSSHV